MKLYISALIVLTVVLIGNSLGPEATHISMRFYDSLLHLLGGVGLGLFLSGLAGSLAEYRLKRRWVVILGVFICGIIWELFEIYYNLSGYPLWTSLYYADTIKDLVLDSIGGALVAFLVIKSRLAKE